MEIEEERRTRLENDAATKWLRLAMDTDEERKARLEIVTKWLRLAMEMDEERRARLEYLSVNQHLRLCAETIEEIEQQDWNFQPLNVHTKKFKE